MDDGEIRRQIWESRVPVEFNFLPSELSIIEKPKPIFMLISRVTYLSLVAEKLQKYIESFVGDDLVEEIWFEYNGAPLKWHYPVGVLVDCLKIDEGIPWVIAVHVKNFPEDEVLHCKSKEVVEAFFIQAVKEADQIKHKGRIVENMTKDDHKKLWSGFVNDRLDQFWKVNCRLMEDSSEHPIRFLPIRVYLSDQLVFNQKLIKPMKNDGQRSTVSDVLCQLSITSDDVICISQGVEIPTDTTLTWMSENLSYPDNFIHLCICAK